MSGGAVGIGAGDAERATATPRARRASSTTFLTTVSVRMQRLGLDRAGLMNACTVTARLEPLPVTPTAT